MALEIKKLETCLSEHFGGSCAYINLDDYADTDTIQCKIANVGDKIVPAFFSFSGNPYFSYDTFSAYSNGDHYARVYVEVEYKKKELEWPESLFNTATGINGYIQDLETLHHIINIRSIAYNKKKMKLQEFVWKGMLKFDPFGQTMVLSEQEFVKDTPRQIHEQTLTLQDFRVYCQRWATTYQSLPTPNETCPFCDGTWSLDNITDYVTMEQEHYKKIGFHKHCLKKHKNQEALNQFRVLFSNVYDVDNLEFLSIPNEYCPCEHCASWFSVNTPDGDIKIGWRKRVLHMEWMQNYRNFSETFGDEEVTKSFGLQRMIHAWNQEKAIDYMKRAKESIQNT